MMCVRYLLVAVFDTVVVGGCCVVVVATEDKKSHGIMIVLTLHKLDLRMGMRSHCV